MKAINIKLRDVCGIYIITNVINGKRYVGSAYDIYDRLHDHMSNLNHNTAHNAHLQAAWNKYGSDSFEYGILEFCDRSERFIREQYYIDTLHPEYNISLNVVANFGHVVSNETKEKISNTLKERYKSGEITTYHQDHLWIHCYLYDVIKFEYLGEFNNLVELKPIIGGTTFNRERTLGQLLCGRYIVVEKKFKCLSELKNYTFKYRRKMQISPTYGDRYLVSEINGNLTYYESVVECSKATGISKSMIHKNSNASKEKPYVPTKYPNLKIYYITEFIDLPYDATPIPEGKVEKSTKNGELCDGNTVVTEEIKESSAPYSIEIEPDLSE